MRTLHIRRYNGFLYLMERNYMAQGISPDYDNLCKVSPQEAATLMASLLVKPWHAGLEVPPPGPVDRIVSLRETEGRFSLHISLPATGPREKACEIRVPDNDYLLEQVRDPGKRATFLRNTGAGFEATSVRADVPACGG